MHEEIIYFIYLILQNKPTNECTNAVCLYSILIPFRFDPISHFVIKQTSYNELQSCEYYVFFFV